MEFLASRKVRNFSGRVACYLFDCRKQHVHLWTSSHPQHFPFALRHTQIINTQSQTAHAFIYGNLSDLYKIYRSPIHRRLIK